MLSPDSRRTATGPTPARASHAGDEDDDDADFRHESLRWIHQALADLDHAIEAGRNDTARRLLHRIQDVLEADER
jgi:hypothetical protein